MMMKNRRNHNPYWWWRRGIQIAEEDLTQGKIEMGRTLIELILRGMESIKEQGIFHEEVYSEARKIKDQYDELLNVVKF